MARQYTCSPFPGRPAVLAALTEAGTWTSLDMERWATKNGSNRPVFEALAYYVRKGRVRYVPNPGQWTPITRFSVAATQRRGSAKVQA